MDIGVLWRLTAGAVSVPGAPSLSKGDDGRWVSNHSPTEDVYAPVAGLTPPECWEGPGALVAPLEGTDGSRPADFGLYPRQVGDGSTGATPSQHGISRALLPHVSETFLNSLRRPLALSFLEIHSSTPGAEGGCRPSEVWVMALTVWNL